MAAILAILGLLATGLALTIAIKAVSWWMGKPESPIEHCGWVEVAGEPAAGSEYRFAGEGSREATDRRSGGTTGQALTHGERSTTS